MSTVLCGLMWLAVALVAVLLVLDWMTMTDEERARRRRAHGWSQERIARHMGRTRYWVRKVTA